MISETNTKKLSKEFSPNSLLFLGMEEKPFFPNIRPSIRQANVRQLSDVRKKGMRSVDCLFVYYSDGVSAHERFRNELPSDY